MRPRGLRCAGRTGEVALVGAALGVILVAAFPRVVAGNATFEPNGHFAGQTGRPPLEYPYEPAERWVVRDAAASPWIFGPLAKTVHEAYADGELPLWNPYAGLGAPLAGNFQSAPFSPVYAPVHVHPTQNMRDLVALLRLLVGGLGCYALLRALGLSRGASFAPSVAYLFSSAFVYWINQVSISVEMLAPWLLLAILGLVRRPSPPRFAALALVVGLAGLGGQPEVLIGLAYLGAAWAVYWFIREGRRPRAALAAAGAAAAGGMIAAPQLLPGLRFITEVSSPHLAFLGTERLPLEDAGTFLLGDADAKAAVSLGIVLTVFAAAGLAAARRRPPVGAGLLLAASAVWAVRTFEGLPGDDLVGLLPGIGESNQRRYAELTPILAGAVFAGLGIDAVRERRPAAPVAAIVVAVALPLLFWDGLGGNAGPALALGAATALGLWAVRWRPVLVTGLAALALAQFAVVTPRDYARPYDPFRPIAAAEFLQENLAPGERATAIGSLLHPNNPSALGIPDTRILDAAVATRSQWMLGTPPHRLTAREVAESPALDALGVRYVATPASKRLPAATGFRLVFTDRTYRRGRIRVWRNLDAYPRAWLVPEVREARGDLEADVGEVERLDLRTSALVERPTEEMRGASGAGEAVVEEIGWNRASFAVDATRGGVLVVSNQWYPGWNAEVDGRETPLRPANVSMQALYVPAGEHRVELSYDPWELTLGLALAGVGLVAVAGGLGAPLARRAAARRRGPEAPSG